LTETIQSAQAAYFYCAQDKVDLVLMDVVTMMGANGLQASKRIKEAFPQIKIIIVTSMPEASWLKKAREYGVDSFWYKEVQTESLMEIMDRTMAGESVYPETSPMVQLGDTTSYELSQRELEILRELTTGATNVQISKKLHIATSTVKTYVDRLMEKTGYHSRTELAVRARETGLVIRETIGE
jgi:two-component system vancomycin resistance associated response regulator VraR